MSGYWFKITVVCLAAALSTALRAAPVAPQHFPELTGVFEDVGTIAVAPPGEPPKVVSLHALLAAQFNPELARLLQVDTGEVRLKHTEGLFEAEITNRDGEVAWRMAWRRGEGYGLRDGRVVLRHKAARESEPDYLLLLDTVTAYKLLQVEVQRLKPTVLGPQAEPMGTYLFHRDE